MEQDNLIEIARHIFGAPAKDPGMICLELDGSVPPGASQAVRNRIISEILMILLMEGVKVRYGDAARLEKLTDDQLRVIGSYVSSFGYRLLVRSDQITEPPGVPEEPREALSDFSERFYNFDDMTWKAFSFQPILRVFRGN